MGFLAISDTRLTVTAQKMKFSIKDFFSKCGQVRRKLQIWPHLLKKSLMENFIFCTVLQEIKNGLVSQRLLTEPSKTH